MRTRVGLFLLGVLAFSSALGNRPEALDDRRIIYDQAFLREGRVLACLSPWPAREEWLPVRDLTYLADHALHGARPAGLVLGNLLLHGLLVLAVHALGRRLVGERAAVAGAALFAVHPIHAESVAWISGRKDSLSALFVVACVVAWLDALRAGKAGEPRRQALVLGLAALALLSKATAIALALLLPLADLLLGPPRPLLRRAATWAPVVVACGAFAVFYSGLVRAWGEAHGTAVIKAFPGDPLATVLCTDAHVVRQYLQGMLWPAGRLFSAQGYKTAVDAAVVGGALVSLAALAGAVALARRSRPPGFAALWFFAALVPFLNLTPHGIPFAERYAHLASVGFCLLAGAGVGWLATRAGAQARPYEARRAGARARPYEASRAGARARPYDARAALLLVLAPLVLAGTWRCRDLARAFETGETLWTRALVAEPDNAVAATNLGSWHEDRAQLARAEECFRAALALDPPISAHLGLARVLAAQGRHEEALERWKHAARLRPNDVRPVYGAATALYRLGRREDALRLYEAIMARWPAASERAVHNRAVILRELGRTD